jgi:GMP synthase-like glutamine amidotransferase
VRAVVISHDPSEQPALVGDELERLGATLDVFVVCESTEDPVSHRAFPAFAGVDLVVAMGAPWSVYDTGAIGSWIHREVQFVRAVHDAGIPYLGICFGGQVLSAALGGTVEPASRPELGWVHLETDDPAIVAPGPWFQWHGDRFTTPPGARELARNDVGVQAFRTGNSVGVQFHPEIDHALLTTWLDGDEPPDPLFTALGIDHRQLLAESVANVAAAEPNTRRLVQQFLGAMR